MTDDPLLAASLPDAGAAVPSAARIGARMMALPALVVLAILLLPYLGLVLATPWGRMAPADGDWAAVRVSVTYTLLALAIDALLGTPLAWWMARRGGQGQGGHGRGGLDRPIGGLLDLAVLVPLLTPPLAMGLLLATAFGPYSVIGEGARRIGVELSNTPAAFLLAQVYASAPYYIFAARAAFAGVPREYEELSLTLGRGRWHTFWHVSLPLARLGIATGLALAWVRALGEFGIALIIAYYPQGIPVRLWVDLQDAGLNSVYPLLWVFFVIGLPVPLLLGLVSRARHGG